MGLLSALFGGGTWTRILHPFIGVVMFVAFLILALRFWHHNLLNRNDREWLRHGRDVLTNHEENVPEVPTAVGAQDLDAVAVGVDATCTSNGAITTTWLRDSKSIAFR